MDLAYKTLMAVTDLLNQLAKTQAERVKQRTDPRYPLECEIDVLQVATGGKLRMVGQAWGHDLSYQGVGLISPFEFLTGRKVFLDLRRAVDHPLLIPAQVMHCRRLTGAVYRSGAVFLYDEEHYEALRPDVAGTASTPGNA